MLRLFGQGRRKQSRAHFQAKKDDLRFARFYRQQLAEQHQPAQQKHRSTISCHASAITLMRSAVEFNITQRSNIVPS